MFTVEFESEDTVITTIDDTGDNEDVQVILDENGDVWVRQWDDDKQVHELICMSDHQFKDILAAWNSTEGAFYRQSTKRKLT